MRCIYVNGKSRFIKDKNGAFINIKQLNTKTINTKISGGMYNFPWKISKHGHYDIDIIDNLNRIENISSIKISVEPFYSKEFNISGINKQKTNKDELQYSFIFSENQDYKVLSIYFKDTPQNRNPELGEKMCSYISLVKDTYSVYDLQYIKIDSMKGIE